MPNKYYRIAENAQKIARLIDLAKWSRDYARTCRKGMARALATNHYADAHEHLRNARQIKLDLLASLR